MNGNTAERRGLGARRKHRAGELASIRTGEQAEVHDGAVGRWGEGGNTVNIEPANRRTFEQAKKPIKERRTSSRRRCEQAKISQRSGGNGWGFFIFDRRVIL